MACEIVEYKRVLFVLWGKPEPHDLTLLMRRVRALHDKVGPYVFIARVPARAEVPDEMMRKALSRAIAEISESCASYHAVMEGVGFFSAAKRAVLASLFFMSKHRGKFNVHSCIQDVVDHVPYSQKAEVEWALRKFEPRGLLGHNLGSISPPATASAPPPAP